MIVTKNVPDDWSIHSVEELFDFISTKSLSRAQLTAEKGKYQYLHYGDIHSTFKYPLVDTEKIMLPSILDDVELKGNIVFLEEGDLVLADASEDLEGVGMCIELKNINEKKVVGGLHTIVCRDKIGKTINGFRTYLFKNPEVLKSIKRIATGASVLGVSKGNLKNISIVVPPLPEQQKIAEILSTVDDKIEVIDQQITETQTLKKGLMQRLLTKGIGHTEFKDSPLGEIPVGWEVVKLGKAAKIIMGQSPKGDSYNRNGIGIPVLNGPTEFTDTYPVPVQFTTKPTKICINGDILFCVRGSTTGRMNIADQEYCIGRGLAAIRGKSDSLTVYLNYVLQNLAKEVLRKAKDMGSTFPNVNSKELNEYLLGLPSLKEQTKIAFILTSIDGKLEILSQKKTHYQTLKKGLMQQLLTGKIRVNSLIV